MHGHRWPRSSVVVVAAVILVVTAHAMLRVAASRATLPAGIALGVIAVVVITHRRLLDALRSWLHRWPQRPPESR